MLNRNAPAQSIAAREGEKVEVNIAQTLAKTADPEPVALARYAAGISRSMTKGRCKATWQGEAHAQTMREKIDGAVIEPELLAKFEEVRQSFITKPKHEQNT